MRGLSRHFWGKEDEREGNCEGGESFSRKKEERGIVRVQCGGVSKKGVSE